MNENSYLRPSDIVAQSNAALNQLRKDNEALETVKTYIDKFIENEDIQSESFHALKLQMEDYRGVIQALMDSMQQDAKEHHILMRDVGDEVLNGEEILRGMELAEADIRLDEQSIESYRTQRNMNWYNPLLHDYYTWMIAKYEYMLAIDEHLYKYYQEKAERYDEIEQKTAGLFETGREVRAVVREALMELGTTFQSGTYTPNPNSTWRFAIGSSGIRVPLSDVSGNYKQKVVEEFEAIHPDIAEKVDRLLMAESCEGLTEGDILNIKYLAYTAEEPYRSLFLDKLGTYEISKLYDSEDANGKTSFLYESGQIVLKYPDAFILDERGSYTSFFHECGHATDYQEVEYYSREYQYTDPETGGTSTLYELMEEDVYNNIREHIRDNDPSLSEEQVELILVSIQYGGSEDDLEDEDLRKIRTAVIEDYNTELKGTSMAAVCDGYGGITNLNIDSLSGYGHRNTDEEGNYTYWYDEEGQPTYKQCSELWAEYFSYYMAGDEDALNKLREYYPNAGKALDAMAEDMKEDMAEDMAE